MSKVTDAIHKDGSEHPVDFYPFPVSFFFFFGSLKNQMESVAHLHLLGDETIELFIVFLRGQY